MMDRSSNRWQYAFQVLLILISLTTLIIVARAWWMGLASQGRGTTLLVLLVAAILLFLVAHRIAEKIVSVSLSNLRVDGQSWEETATPEIHYKLKRRSVKEALISSLPDLSGSN